MAPDDIHDVHLVVNLNDDFDRRRFFEYLADHQHHYGPLVIRYLGHDTLIVNCTASHDQFAYADLVAKYRR